MKFNRFIDNNYCNCLSDNNINDALLVEIGGCVDKIKKHVLNVEKCIMLYDNI